MNGYGRKGFRYIFRGNYWQIFVKDHNMKAVCECCLTKKECEKWIDNYVEIYGNDMTFALN